MGMFKWLYPGMRVKRWILLCCFGMILCSIGFVLAIFLLWLYPLHGKRLQAIKDTLTAKKGTE